MARMVLIEEFHLVITVGRHLSETASAAIRRTLDSRRLQADLRRAIRNVFGRYPALRRAHLSLTR